MTCRPVALGLGSALIALAVAAADKPLNVLLITVDTLRPDALGWVSGGGTTPAIDRLASEGFRFPGAVSPVPLTLPAHSSLFSGLIPPRHGVRDNGQVLAAGVPLLAERFGQAGYQTAAFVSGYPLSRPFGLARGFSHYDDALPAAGSGQGLERRAAETTAAAVEWLKTTPGPWLLWVHYYDPHLPYEPGSGPQPSIGRADYDGEVARVDRAVDDLRTSVAAKTGDVLTVFTADHGESLGEHGEATHGFFVYDSTLRVPLIFHWPGRVAAGESLRAARLIDVAPTILDLVGLPRLVDAGGVSLGPTLKGEEQPQEPAYFESQQPWRSYGWAPLSGLLKDGWKWIAAPRPELYRIEDDPGESRDLYNGEVATGRALQRELRALLTRPPVTSETEADPAVLTRLRALGYLGGVTVSSAPAGDLPDPKDRLELRRLLTEGQELLDAGSASRALERFDRVLEAEEDNRFALSRSGLALMQLNRLDGAVDRLSRSVELAGDDPETRSVLAEALGRLGLYERAVTEWMEVARHQPEVARVWSNLGASLGRAGRLTEAVEALRQAQQLDPDNPDRWIRLAFAEFGAGSSREAVEHLATAREVMGDAFPHHGALGLILYRMGEVERAREALSRAGRSEPEFVEARLTLARIEAAAGQSAAARFAIAEVLQAAPGRGAEIRSDPLLAPFAALVSKDD